MSQAIANTESAILSRVVLPRLSPAAVEAILSIEFPPADVDQINELAAKAREGTITDDERIELENFERVGHLVSILQSQARRLAKNSIQN